MNDPTNEDFYQAMGLEPADEFLDSVYALARAMADRDPILYDADAATTDKVVALARELAGL